jgi:hypothetical protein
MPPKRIGRPPVFDVPASRRISVAVTPAQLLELRRVAAENGGSMTGIIRQAVNEFVADYDERRPPFPPRRR